MRNTPNIPHMSDSDMDAHEKGEELYDKLLESEVTKTIGQMTDAEIAEEAYIEWHHISSEAEKRLMKDIADLDAASSEDGFDMAGTLSKIAEMDLDWDAEKSPQECSVCGFFSDELDADQMCPDCLDQFEAANTENSPVGVRRQMLMNAADLVDGDRNAQYGDPRQDFLRTTKYWNAHIHGIIERKAAAADGALDTNSILDPADVAIMMALLKVSRLAWDPAKEDTWTDLAGYAACGLHCTVPEED
jgi:hypothetical protein